MKGTRYKNDFNKLKNIKKYKILRKDQIRIFNIYRFISNNIKYSLNVFQLSYGHAMQSGTLPNI